MIFLGCNILDLKNKQVVSVETGTVLGFISDIEIETETGSVANVVIYGKPKYLGFAGKEDDIVIPWKNIQVIGEETILVSGPVQFKNSLRKNL